MNHIFLRAALAMTAMGALSSSPAVWAANPLGAYIGAGSTITKDVPPGALAVGRAQQVVKDGWAARKAKKREEH